MSNWYNISTERAARIRAEVTAEVKDEVLAELEPVIREQAEEELWDKAREQVAQEAKEAAEQKHLARSQAVAEARRELESAAQSEEPSARLQRGFVEFVKETELDARAQAVVASGTAEKVKSRARWSRRLLGPLPWMLFVAAAPLLYAVWTQVGSTSAPGFIAASLGLLAVFLPLLVSNTRRQNRLEERSCRLDKAASDYLVLAERAKSYRLVHAERLETKGKLDDLTNELRNAKVKLDDNYHPPVAELDVAKDSVRQRIAVEAVDLDAEFDERLAEAEAVEEVEVGVKRATVG